MKYYVHIVSHSHWDREWYMSYEEHHMRLIDLIDDVLDKIDSDSKFSSFHLDGHVALIFDYLDVRPDKKQLIIDSIKNGKLKIGPWSVLQDAFLTSSEANVRNLYYGIKLANSLGGCQYLGYYPDTFGIYSQAAQLLKKANINNMFFGRGVTPTGFNNQVGESFSSQYSEMKIVAPSGDDVLGVLFANWYSNGNEIPINGAKKWWDQKIQDASKYAKTKHLLFMNGCDHQPLQKNITQAIDVANQLYDDIEFKHSSLQQYYEAINSEINIEQLDIIKGELKSQNTDGYFSLVNTASSRVMQKVKNDYCQDLLEKYVEPLSVMIDYDNDKIEYAWKLLMKNHPHDSICGCSCDSVHDTMDNRFEDSKNASKHIIDKCLYSFKMQGLKSGNGISFTLFNTLSVKKYHHYQKVLINKYYFDEYGYQLAKSNASNYEYGQYQIIDSNSNNINCDIVYDGVIFGYDLPDDGFRKPYYANQILVDIEDKIDEFSHKTYFVVEKEYKTNYENEFKNQYYEVKINNDGSFTIKDENNIFNNIGVIFDQGDIGNEYMFGRVKNDKNIYIDKSCSKFSYIFKNTYKQCTLDTCIVISKSAQTSILEKEKLELRSFYNRDAKRSEQYIIQPIKIIYRLDNNSKFISVNIKYTNKASDHRLRMRFNLKNKISHVNVDSIFDVVKRDIKVSKYWKNESNDQHMSKFISADQKNCNLIIGTLGLHEYEAKEDYIDITLSRSISEMGDWGLFQTPKAQLLDQEIDCNLFVGIFNNKYDSYSQARMAGNNTIGVQIDNFDGTNEFDKTYIKYFKEDCISITSLKKNVNKDTIMRMFSMEDAKFITNKKCIKTDLLEQDICEFDNKISKNEILTIKIEE